MKRLPKQYFLLLLIALFVMSCADSDAPTLQQLTDYQKQLEEKINNVAEKATILQDSIATLAAANEDTSFVFKDFRFLKNAQFLLETQYDETDALLQQLKAKKIKKEKIHEALLKMAANTDSLEVKYNLN